MTLRARWGGHQGDAVGPGPRLPVRVGWRGESGDGKAGSCSSPIHLWRSAEQKPGGGDALDEVHSTATLGTSPQRS